MRAITVIAAVAASLFGAYSIIFPTQTFTGLVTATVVVDGRKIVASGVWRTTGKSQWGIDARQNWSLKDEGDALVFPIDDDSTLFLTIGRSAWDCDGGGHTRPCSLPPSGLFVFAKHEGTGRPRFGEFGWAKGKMIDPHGEAVDEVWKLGERGFDFRSLSVQATNMGLATDMTERFPWILELDRTDYRKGKKMPGDFYHWRRGVIYAQYFTTVLP